MTIPRPENANETIQFYIKNRKFFEEWDPERAASFFTEEFWNSRLKNCQSNFLEDKSLTLFLWTKASDQLAGSIAFSNVERFAFQACRLGYRLGEEFCCIA